MPPKPSPHYDQLGRAIQLRNGTPNRIVSLVPSQTEFLFALGLAEKIVGITKFCIHPAKKSKKIIKIGGTKNFNLKKIERLEPDLIIANKEENTKEGIEALSNHFPVWVSDVQSLTQAYQMMQAIGHICGQNKKALTIVEQIQTAFAGFTPPRRLKVAYLIWRKPYMTVGNDTFIHHLLTLAGFDNLFEDFNRYPQIDLDLLQERKTDLDVIFLSSEPYPFKKEHFKAFSSIISTKKIHLVDGELFSWYGNRLLKTPSYLHQLWKNILQNESNN